MKKIGQIAHVNFLDVRRNKKNIKNVSNKRFYSDFFL